jgi:uncharacterized protein YkwD
MPVLFLTLGLGACSGGGTTPGAGANPTPSPAAPTPTAVGATPTPFVTASPSTAGNVTGAVYDLSSYNPSVTGSGGVGWSVLPNGSPAPGVDPVAGAIVVIGTSLIAGATAPPSLPSGDVMAVANSGGAFALDTTATGTAYIMVFPGASDTSHTAAIHRTVSLVSGKNVLPVQLMAAVTSDEAGWLAQVNADRAANGAPPLVFDEALVESARYWANFMGRTGYFNHCIPASSCGGTATPPPGAAPQDATPATRDAYFNAYFGSWGENIAAGFPNWESAESAFMAEKANCPGDTATGCPFNDSTGHFLNIVDASYLWVGLGEATNGESYGTYYDQEFDAPGSGLASTSALPDARMPRPLSPKIEHP